MKARAIITISCLSALLLSCSSGLVHSDLDRKRNQLNHDLEDVRLRTRGNRAKREVAKSKYKRCRERESKILDGFTDEQLDAYSEREKALDGGSEERLKLAQNRLEELLPESMLLALLDVLAEKGRILQEMEAAEREWKSIEAELQRITQEINDIRLEEEKRREEMENPPGNPQHRLPDIPTKNEEKWFITTH
jgi:hypothetical protein